MLSTENSIACSLSIWGDNGLIRVSSIDSARVTASPTGARIPNRPPSKISDGPLGQFVETTGVPQAIASIKTEDNPSRIEERTKRADLDI